ncbi:chloride channel protein, partial [Streptomyces sp. SID89]|nr:chloride channel protein [Streptomyces sp. SID89]
MTQPGSSAAPPAGTQPEEADRLRDLLRTSAYRRTLALSAAVGVPVSLAAFWFLAGLHELEHALWTALPDASGWNAPPWWWPLPLLAVAGVAVGLVVRRLPGTGGHVPAAGLHSSGTDPATL